MPHVQERLRQHKRSALLFCLLLVTATGAQVQAQLIDKRILPLTAIDQQYMQAQRELAAEVTLRHFGTRCCRTTADLAVLQRLVDERILSTSQMSELQALGVVMGDLLARELDMHWVVYEDIQGRSRALQYKETENFLFPVTMLSRRYTANAEIDVKQIYQQAVDAVNAAKPPLPFQ